MAFLFYCIIILFLPLAQPFFITPMETVVKILILLHATAGGFGLLTGPGALLVKKGSKIHRLFGKIFYWSMIVASCFALVISNLPKHHNFFLFTIGLFTLYMVLSGRRFLALKMLFRNQTASAFDWVLAILMAIAGSCMIIYGWSISSENTIGIVLIVFGFISLRMVGSSILLFRKINVKPNSWLIEHIGRMIGANIAAFTAFLVVNNNNFLPPLVAWLSPTVVFTPLIIYYTLKEARKVKIRT